MGRHAKLFSDEYRGDDKANSEDEQDFISNASICVLVMPFNFLRTGSPVIQDLQSIGCTYHIYGRL